VTSTSDSERAVLSLGSNVGDRNEHLARAREALFSPPELSLAAASLVYETPPLDVDPDHGPYLNQVLIVNSQLASEELLRHCQAVEIDLGRVSNSQETLPRTIDIDLITYGDTCCSNDDLQLPHPRYRERRFVLVPLLEVYPAYRDPTDGLTARELLAACADDSNLLRLTARGPQPC
jgi:2-amino-4-hydroxy-6-hydroxymethyldihydropteridine diphosphokinase